MSLREERLIFFYTWRVAGGWEQEEKNPRGFHKVRGRVIIWRFSHALCAPRSRSLLMRRVCRIIFITTNSWLCTFARILQLARQRTRNTVRPWRINLLIKAIPWHRAATTYLIRHRPTQMASRLWSHVFFSSFFSLFNTHFTPFFQSRFSHRCNVPRTSHSLLLRTLI